MHSKIHNSRKSQLTCTENHSDIIDARVYEDLDQPPFFVATDGLKKKKKRLAAAPKSL